MPGNANDGGMTALTPALRAYHVVSEFHGQSSPLLSVSHLRLNDIDWTLFRWANSDCTSPTHPTHPARKPPQNRILACWIYGELYKARNDFAHGNPVDANRLRLESGRYLHYYASPLYRMALTGFLNLGFTHPPNEEIDTGFPEAHDLWDPQEDFERALATVHRPPRNSGQR
jgi:hypothetical protein